MDNKFLKFSLACATGVVLFTSTITPAMATEHAVAGFVFDKPGNELDITPEFKNELSILSSSNTPIPGFDNVGIANVDTNLLIREKPDVNSNTLGKMPKDSGCKILEANKDGWTKVKSGKVTGYVKSQYLIIGPEASKLALEKANHIAVFNGNGNLRIRKEPSTEASIIDFVAPGEEILVLDALIITYGEEYNKWVKVSLDGEEDGTVGYVAKEFVDLSYKLAQAYSMEELKYGKDVSAKRIDIVDYAKEFLGNRYVWGGTSLTSGVDCSGFTQAIYIKHGYSIARVSRNQAKGGTKISQDNLKPGDLVFYGNNSTGYINHVAIYIGNNKIIHASNKRDGIKISGVNYRKPIKCVRYIYE